MGLCYTVLMLKREGGIDAGLFRAYAIQSFSVIVWCIGYTFMFYTENKSDVLLFYKISAFGWALLPSSNLYLVWRLHKYMKGGKERPWLSFLVFIPYPVFLAAMTSENFMVFEFKRTPYGWIETIPFTIMTLLYICAILA